MDYKTLEKLIIEELHIDAVKTKEIIENIKEHTSSYIGIDYIMRRVNDFMHGFGVESISNENTWVNRYFTNMIALYINMGDTYDTTFIYDTINNEFTVDSWGNWYENYQNNIDEDEYYESLQ